MIAVIPIGPIGLLCVQRTINRGWKIGFYSGVGAAVSDLIYYSLAVFGMGFIDGIIERNRCLINEVTGIIFLIVGISLLINSKKNTEIPEETKEDLMHPALSTFLMGFSNPMTFFIFLAIFTKMHINVYEGNLVHNIFFVISILTGSSLFWLAFTNIIKFSKKNWNVQTFKIIDKIIGTIIIIFGIVSILKGIFKF